MVKKIIIKVFLALFLFVVLSFVSVTNAEACSRDGGNPWCTGGCGGGGCCVYDGNSGTCSCMGGGACGGGGCDDPGPPSNLNYTCSPTGNSVTITWSAGSNADYYSLRLNDLTNPWDCNNQPGDVCVNTTNTSYTFTVNPSHEYDFWVHSRVDCDSGKWSSAPHLNPISCALDCEVSASAQCISGGTQVEVAWNNLSDPNLVFDRFVVRGADTTQTWPTNGVFRDMGAGNTGATSTIFDVGPNAGQVDPGIPFSFSVSINNGNTPNYLPPQQLCRGGAGTVTCLTPTPSPSPSPTPYHCEPGGNCCICIAENPDDPSGEPTECNLLSDFCDDDPDGGLVGRCTTSLVQCEEASGCNCVPDTRASCGGEGEPCCLTREYCNQGLYCNNPENICRGFTAYEALRAFCVGGSGPVNDPSEGTIFTAIGCIPTLNVQVFIEFYLRWGMGLAGGIAFLLIVYSGVLLITGQGNPQKVKAAKQLLAAAITGLLLFTFSAYLMRIIGSNILRLPISSVTPPPLDQDCVLNPVIDVTETQCIDSQLRYLWEWTGIRGEGEFELQIDSSGNCRYLDGEITCDFANADIYYVTGNIFAIYPVTNSLVPRYYRVRDLRCPEANWSEPGIANGMSCISP